MQLVFPPRLELARTPTPLQRLERLSAELGGPTIWVKRDDLTECAASGNKIRKLEFTLARAMAAGCDTLITCGGLQSNHCRATAVLGARLGLKVHLLLRDEGPRPTTPDGNLFIDLLAGATLSIYGREQYQRQLPELLAQWRQHYASAGRTAWVIPTGASDATGVWGYVNCARELQQDFASASIRPGAIVHATGSGGTQAGLTAGAALFDLDCPVWGIAVCDSAEYFRTKVHADLRDWRALYELDLNTDALAVNVNEAHIGPGYAVATEKVHDCIRRVAALEGLLLDPVYSGKAFQGMIEEIESGQFRGTRDIVFIHTGGLFGLFAQRQRLGLRDR